jgi:hypothetical protein
MLSLDNLDWDNAGNMDIIKPGTLLPTPTLLFDRIEDEKIA